MIPRNIPVRIPPEPYFLECNSYEMGPDHEKVLVDVAEALSGVEADWYFDVTKLRFNGIAYVNTQRIDFVINGYCLKKNDTYSIAREDKKRTCIKEKSTIVEFQRRSGCCLAFLTFMYNISTRLGLSRDYKRPPFILNVNRIDAEPMEPMEPMTARDVDPIVRMIKSEYSNMQVDGLQVIVSVLSQQIENVAWSLWNLEVIQVIVIEALKQTTDSEIRRCMATALSKFVLVCNAMWKKGSDMWNVLMNYVGKFESISDLEVQRQASSALSCLQLKKEDCDWLRLVADKSPCNRLKSMIAEQI